MLTKQTLTKHYFEPLSLRISTFHSNPPHYRHLHLKNLLTSIPKNKHKTPFGNLSLHLTSSAAIATAVASLEAIPSVNSFIA